MPTQLAPEYDSVNLGACRLRRSRFPTERSSLFGGRTARFTIAHGSRFKMAHKIVVGAETFAVLVSGALDLPKIRGRPKIRIRRENRVRFPLSFLELAVVPVNRTLRVATRMTGADERAQKDSPALSSRLFSSGPRAIVALLGLHLF